MPNWRDTLEGLRDGSIPPPTPDPAGATVDWGAVEAPAFSFQATDEDENSNYFSVNVNHVDLRASCGDPDALVIRATADGGAVNISASGAGATMNLGVGSGMSRPAIIDLSDAGVSITGTGGVGFYGVTPVAQPTGVAVTAAAIHAALVDLGLITA